MKKLVTFTNILIVLVLMIGCGTQNEYLSKGKEWVKSDKRGRIPKAVAQFELAVEKEPENAEAHYLLGYYDESATIEHRAEQMVLAYKNDKRKYQRYGLVGRSASNHRPKGCLSHFRMFRLSVLW